MIIDKIYDFLIIHFIEPLSKLNNFPNIIQGIGLALLTILIPLAIAVLAEIYQKRKHEENEFVYLDLHVILEKVFNIKLLILSVFLIFLPMFFWEILIGLDKLIAVHFIFIGIILVVNIIFKVSCWIKGNVFDLRFSYLKKVKKYDDLEIVWKSIWKVTRINIQNEKEFCKIFFSKIDHLLGLPPNRHKAISKLLNDFYVFINERSITSLLELNTTFTRVLEIYFKTWQNRDTCIKNEDTEYSEDDYAKSRSSYYYGEILRVLESILINIEERSLKEKGAFSIFIHFKKHVEKYKDELVDNGNKRNYISNFFEVFYGVFFENIEKISFSERNLIWNNCFPKEWKISKTNLIDKEKQTLSKLLYNCFFSWAWNRIDIAIEEEDFVIGEVAINLFPEVDSDLIIRIFAFIILKLKTEYKVKLAIEKPWGFITRRSRVYRIKTSEKEEEGKRRILEDIENEKQRTFELAFLLFKEYLPRENIVKYIKETKDLKYPEGSNEENEKKEWLKYFKGMLKCLDG